MWPRVRCSPLSEGQPKRQAMNPQHLVEIVVIAIVITVVIVYARKRV